MTTKLYLEQTGDSSLLYENVPYFKDAQVMRGTAVDEAWEGEVWQKDAQDNRYEGTVLEHLLVQALCAFYEVGSTIISVCAMLTGMTPLIWHPTAERVLLLPIPMQKISWIWVTCF